MLLSGLFLSLVAGAALCLYRLAAGPEAGDRVAAGWTLGTLGVGLCVLAGLAAGRAFYFDVALVWAVLCFVGTLALAKHLEGKYLDE
jgi:multicomponent Na+:H+ antiporter subunit F